MTVIVRLRDGKEYRLDRNLRQDQVAEKINAARRSVDSSLISFETDQTPTGQLIWLDPAEIVGVRDDRSMW